MLLPVRTGLVVQPNRLSSHSQRGVWIRESVRF
jgi:hypothetical protein